MPGTQWIQKRRNLPHTPLPVACYQRKILATRKQFCHWLIRDWISVLKFQRKPRQVLIIYQNINRLNSHYLHLPAFHYVPPYFALIQLFALCKEGASSEKQQSHHNNISTFFNETRWEKIFGGGQIEVPLSWACDRSYRGTDKSLCYLWQQPD